MKRYWLAALPLLVIGYVLFSFEPGVKKSNHREGFFHASIFDTLPAKATYPVAIEELQGIQWNNAGKSAYLFEYKADHKAILKMVASLPVSIDSVRADLQCLPLIDTHLLNKLYAVKQKVKGSFSWHEALDQFTAYSCIKDTDQHVVLLHNTTDRVIHLIL